MTSAPVRLALLALACAASACAAASPARAPAKVTSLDGRHDEINERLEHIRALRGDAGLAPEPGDDVVRAMSAMPPREAAAACELPPATTGTCGDVCRLGDAICDDASAICRIADELPGDAWAAERCGSAKGSCREAQDRCCACRDDGGLP